MKIALFSDTYLPSINGVATHVKTLKEGLTKIGHDVLVVTADASAKEYYVEDGVLHCPSTEIKRFYGNGIAQPEKTKSWLVHNDYHFDIVHVHSEFSMGLSGIRMAKREDAPVIYTMHTMWDQYLHYIASPDFIPIVRRLEHAYIRHFLGKVDEIIGPSARVQGFMEKCGVYRNVNVVPNAVELDVFSREQVDAKLLGEAKERYGFRDEDFHICFCGRLGKEKSVELLLDYFAAYDQPDDHMKLVIVGDGPMRPKLEEQVKTLGIGERVIFTGSVPHVHMREIYACCDLFATASRSEVNSISMLEAMAMSLPVIHINDDENPGQVEEGKNGFTFHSAEEFCAIIGRLCNDPDELKKVQRSTADSVNHAKQEELAKQVESVYLKGMSQRKAV